MKALKRTIEDSVWEALTPNKVVVLLGPRRVGKTTLLQQIISRLEEPYLLLNGEDQVNLDVLKRRSIQNYKNFLGDTRLLLIDEAQKIDDIGNILKLMVDHIDGLRVLVTGSSAFDISNRTGEPLTGRKKTFNLYSLSEAELSSREDAVQRVDNLRRRLVFGNYPELLQMEGDEEKAEYLQEVVNSHLLKDILTFDDIRNSDKILDLLRLIAFQVGSEVSTTELGKKLQMSKNTVEKYLDLLSKIFVIYKVQGFSRNLRKEVTKSARWYFYDNGIRNVLAGNLNSIDLRADVGLLWENYILAERLKHQSYNRMLVYNYFWRTYDQQEIDWVEDRGGQLHGYELKWNPNKNPNAPIAWRKAYPEAQFQVINRENYNAWIS
ncbi:MAG: ATP-binding protein [Bacteroidota bacterium]